jgi:hypothetical protein
LSVKRNSRAYKKKQTEEQPYKYNEDGEIYLIKSQKNFKIENPSASFEIT